MSQRSSVFSIVVASFLFHAATALPQTQATATQASVAPMNLTPVDSRATREQFTDLLQRHPPEVGKVLKLDPTLWKSQEYLASYPALAAFVAEHPEIAHNPSYYLESVWVPSPQTTWGQILEGLMVLIGMFGLIWLVKTLIDHRRWSRVSRVQAEVHNKILDRFASNEDLLAYVQTPAGRRFLESAPIPLDATREIVSPPIGRILWSVQVGVIAVAAGIGLLLISNNVDPEAVEPLFAMGVLAISVGGGFVLSAVVSFILSRKLGLWRPAVAYVEDQSHSPASE